MPKHIVFCADGTWNGPKEDAAQQEAPDVTNVLKLFVNLAGTVLPESVRKQDEQEKVALDASGNPAQVAKYIHGVGDSQNLLTKILGGVFGAGFIQRIVRGYTFISRHYEPGDLIDVVGFSRGAYTVRALAGMITRVGLLRGETLLDGAGNYDVELAYRRGLSAWIAYRKAIGRQSPLFGYLDEFAAEPVPENGYWRDVSVEAVAVWDTVGSLGLPLYALREDERNDLFRFADNQLSGQVRYGFHAVSIDEEREDFTPTLWSPREGISQVWFAGAHSDVGGGYPECGLCDITLNWMIGKLCSIGVRFVEPLVYRGDSADPQASLHAPWTQSPWIALPKAMRIIPEGALFHASVQKRLGAKIGYAPACMASLLARGLPLPDSIIVS
jgi:uncharacterized protein (DUF2235 family)